MKTLRDVWNQPSDLVRRIKMIDPKLAGDLDSLKLGWYRVNNQSDDDDTTEVFVYDIIGGWFGVDAAEFVKELQDITTSHIKVRINSPGGNVYDSVAIHNALMMHSAEITVYVDSLAASGASVIAMAGDKVIMLPGSQMMIHDALMYALGNAKELREQADFLDGQSQNIAHLYSARAGGEPDDWREKMLAESWYFAQEAVDAGLADEVYSKTTSDSEESEEDDDESEEEVVDNKHDLDVQALMKIKHNISNRGFKYPGRRKAPEPVNSFAGFAGSLIDTMFAGRN